MCDKNYNLIGYVRDEITAEEKSAILGHLQSCSDCQKEVKGYEGLFNALRQIEVIEPSSNFEYRVMEKVDQVKETIGIGQRIADFGSGMVNALRPSLRAAPPWVLSAAAHIILFALLGFILIEPTQRTIQKNYNVPLIQTDNNSKVCVPPTELVPSFVPNPISVPPPIEPINQADIIQPVNQDVEEQFLEHLASGRSPENRKALLARYGGDDTTEHAVASGIKWLKQSQESNGSWNPVKYGGLKEYQVGLTSLVLLTFLGDGNSSQNGPYAKTVDAGINYLVKNQQANGLFGPARIDDKPVNYMYNHGIATIAVLENYCMTKDKNMEEPVKQAVSFIVNAQNAAGGWGYQSHNGVNDTSTTVWQVLALRIARTLKLPGVQEALNHSSRWLASITNEKGIVGYQQLNHWPNGYYATTAAGMFAQLFIGCDKELPLIKKQEKILANYQPKMHSTGGELDNDFYYWYFGTLAMVQEGGEQWNDWNKNLKQALVKNQKAGKTSEAGSWEPIDRWSFYGGRLYTTSMAILTLQSYYRYTT